MKILGIDTSSAVLSIGLIEGETVLGEFVQNKALTHSEKLMPHIAYLMEALDEKVSEMDYFAATIGPGSFTGIRIGVATANAFGLAHDKKVIEVSTLEALAANFDLSDATIISTMYAQRDDYYRGIYRFGNDENAWMTVLKEEAALSREEILEEALSCAKEGKVIFVGEITQALNETQLEGLSLQAGNSIQKADLTRNFVRGSVLCKLAQKKVDQAKKYAEPVYIRKPQAEVQYEEKHGAK